MELEIHYPSAMLRRPDDRGYRFSINLNGTKSGEIHENPYVHGVLTEPHEDARALVLDTIPMRSRSILNLEVI